jgi:hypothetical protein
MDDDGPRRQTLTPGERSLRARAAAYAMHANGGTNTGPAFAARLRRLEDQVDPGHELPPEERARRTRLAMKAQMAALSLKSLRARSKNKKTTAALGSPAVVRPEVGRGHTPTT